MRGTMTKLRALRCNRGGPHSRKRPLTLRTLEARTGYSLGHLSDVEQGKKRAGDDLVAALARIFDKPVPQMRRICNDTYREAQRAAA